MGTRWKDAGHLIRPAAVFVLGLILFIIVRGAVVPPGFGKYGHYRAGALDLNRAKPVRFAGQAVCADCHTDELAARNAGVHRTVSCEACHGPAAVHAEDPEKARPPKPQIAALCARCHQADAAKPAWFKQVATSDHYAGNSCESCHQPHSPKL